MRLPKLTYANVVSSLALVLALGGSAYAAGKINSEQIAKGGVHTKNVRQRAIVSGKLAVGAVRSNQIADRAVSAAQIAPGAIGSKQIGGSAVSPANLEFPVFYAATPSGGFAAVTAEPVPYPLSGATWTQRPDAINVLFGAATATLAYDGSGSGSCRAFFEIRVDGRQVGGGEISTDSTTPRTVEQSLGAQPEIGPTAPTQRQLSASLSSNGDCTSASSIDSTRFRVLDFG